MIPESRPGRQMLARRTRQRRLVALLVAGVLAALPIAMGAMPASAHVSTVGYSRITADDTSITWMLWLDPFHLNTFLTLDEDFDGDISPSELEGQAEAIRQLVQPGLEATDVDTGERPDGVAGDVTMLTMADTGLSGDAYTSLGEFPLVQIPVRFEFADFDPASIQLTYNLFLAVGFGDHNNVAEIDIDGASRVFTFTPDEPAVLSGGDAGTSSQDGGTGLEPLLFVGFAVVLVAGIALVQRRTSRTSRPHPATPHPRNSPTRSLRSSR